MIRLKLPVFCLTLAAGLAGGCGLSADTLIFPNGIRLKCEILEAGAERVSVRAAGKIIHYARSDISRMEIDFPADLKKSKDAYQQGRFAEAAKAAENLEAQRPFFRSLAFQTLLRSYLQLGRTGQALQVWGQMAARDVNAAREEIDTFLADEDLWHPDQAAATLRSLQKLGLKKNAKNALEVLILLQQVKTGRLKNNSPALLELANGSDSLQRAAAVFLEGFLAWRQNQPDLFLAKIEQSAAKASPAQRAYGAYWAGRLYLKQQRNDDALLAFLRIGLIHERMNALAGNALFEAAKLLQPSRPDLAESFLKTIIRKHQACSQFKNAHRQLQDHANQ